MIVIHPFVQTYRRTLYDRLAARVAELGGELVVVWNTPPPRVAGRQDSISATWATAAPNRWVTIAGRDVGFRRLSGLAMGPEDLVIVEQAVKNLETYPLLLSPGGRGPGVAMWGHGRTYSISQPPPVAAFKQWLTRRSEWFFAYTEAGARHVIERGFPADRVTVLNNTIDTDGLRAALAAVDDVDAFREAYGLTPGRTALFLGGVDKAKGIDFLLRSASLAARHLPGFVLLVAGAGAELDRVRECERAGGPVRALGRIDGQRKAQALAASDVLAIPEWIGLVAVDSLVSGRPIVGTLHPSHAPEREYLTDGVTATFSAHDPMAYATAITDLLGDPVRLAGMQAACRAAAPAYSMSSTVDAFVSGLLQWEKARA